jgi:hypothetical protein
LHAAGLELVSSGIRWLASVDVLPAWLGYVENQLGALAPPAGKHGIAPDRDSTANPPPA